MVADAGKCATNYSKWTLGTEFLRAAENLSTKWTPDLLNAFFRPNEPCWPPESAWNALNASVNGRLLVPENIVQPCLENEDSTECIQSLENLGKDPFYIQTNPGASESSGRV